MSQIPDFLSAICDDAAVFPPGLAALPDAVAGHASHRASRYAELVGPLVLAAPALAELGSVLGDGQQVDIAVTSSPGPAELLEMFVRAKGLPVHVRGVEITIPRDVEPGRFFAELGAVLGQVDVETNVFVETPRDERGAEIVRGCARHGYGAKLRTGGIAAALYPDEAELAASICALSEVSVPFKATAGLHRAVRNTDPVRGFEQHGFLNLLAATDMALRGDEVADVTAALAERDPASVTSQVRGLAADRLAAVRRQFRSFGTCSIAEPLAQLIDLGLVPSAVSNPAE